VLAWSCCGWSTSATKSVAQPRARDVELERCWAPDQTSACPAFRRTSTDAGVTPWRSFPLAHRRPHEHQEHPSRTHQCNGRSKRNVARLEPISAMDAANEMLRLVGHVISLDKVLMRIARLAPGSMLVGVRTHQQRTQTSDMSFGTTNRNAECNWHCSRALHRFFICTTTFEATPTNRTPQCNWHCCRALHCFFIWAFFWYRRKTFKPRRCLNDKKTFFRLNGT